MTTSNTSTSTTPITPQPSGRRTTAPDPGRGNGNGNGKSGGRSDSTAADALLWIELLLRQFPELLVELAPSYRSPSALRATPAGSGPAPAGPTRAEREEALRAEQAHGLTPSGSRTSPVRLHISDAVRDITDGVIELDEAVHDRLRMPRPRREQVSGRLLRVAGLLDRAAADDVLLEHIRDEARRMARRCTRALGGAEPVVRVGGRCPWCDSVSLRAFPARRAVLCVNPACRCTDPACDCRTDPAHRHAWSEGAWARLAAESGGDLAELTGATADTARREGGR
ncbi:hypothetical protein YW3DRAFT_01551 [Streptomyces sp. MnatMP-M77]|uniref:hypothetical protein n=1 Tax=unclassified Streptomyces TaxID=2593676 RepID=UPI000804FEC6|nr:hypothetical protein [Streptomyces sp. MnatMP-M77]MYT80648.1 hypothetical protein [Streptomyces sp. SID8364]SBV00591.1 hypothetical protein YW3DRAFT_01551 [Streptomyces sp. MnatMP-M77]